MNSVHWWGRIIGFNEAFLLISLGVYIFYTMVKKQCPIKYVLEDGLTLAYIRFILNSWIFHHIKSWDEVGTRNIKASIFANVVKLLCNYDSGRYQNVKIEVFYAWNLCIITKIPVCPSFCLVFLLRRNISTYLFNHKIVINFDSQKCNYLSLSVSLSFNK